ncbi:MULTISPECIES: ADP-ribosylglycohydrolase family protein [unclassified Breznakia]|uniref:ADP-ribosylglycohydrolase family protein n=1 Tax=unclassified Breznakia TaxID=2623764 RepID=UPI00247675E6|nr:MULTISPECIES: ADP-ribosylglycohydrolase family protein [unclassified Breznakia]MDH6368146.1 ADP-ribosylglycohydrolase [Breznakia sp. PH1-1]MDH6405227.1 ADP-ribosylglycohydrolase [Breznakia sp. PF1-11]MDH6412941.1 ADP-ribosylglycohydrolase [Breznakia sp. PFB1-11]MDH6415303.1 ADP-ribosylglycohydrolase [Breznakia sp. PFB1-14]MDH6417612.1 ADP-ribosylglycohydrolase [Breznakia sp. PFB1-4]
MNLNKKIESTLGLAAIADAMGAATENLTRAQIMDMYDGPVTDFKKPGVTAFALGNEAGEVTDDFSQIYFLSKSILKNGGKIDKQAVSQAILDWSEVPRYFNRFAGPTTRTAIAMYKDPNTEMKPLPGAVTVDYASKATNGGAMKIAPAGLLHPGDIEGAIRDAICITSVTHDNSLAIAGACAVAAATSAGLLESSSMDQVIAAGIYGAVRSYEIACVESRDVAGSSLIKRIHLAIEIANEPSTKEQRLQKLADIIGNGLHVCEAVPCAFGIMELNKDSAMQAVYDAVNIGYDTDTIATIVATMVGPFVDTEDAHYQELFKKVQEMNNMDIVQLAKDLTEVVNG